MTNIQELLADFNWDNYRELSDSLTAINLVDLDNELARQATIYSYYNGLMSAAKSELSDLEAELNRLSGTVRSNLKRGSSVKLTAKDLDDLVFCDDTYILQNELVNQASFRYDVLKGLCRALEHKKDMLVQISSNRRAETKLYN